MQLMQRITFCCDDEAVDECVQTVTKYKGACDNVWLLTQYGYPSKSTHKQVATFLSGVAKKFRDKGVTVSLQVSNTIGHGVYMSRRDCTGLVFEGSPVENLVGHDGTVASHSFCWRGKFFRAYINETLEYYLKEINPEVVWVDDDLRVRNHAPVSFGCFCPDCIRAFNEKYQSNFDREQLVEAILHGEIEWRKKYIEFLRESFYDFVYEISSTVHKVCPNAKMGYQYYCNGAYSGYGFDYVFDAMRDATGYAPLSRPGGGAYTDYDVNEFLQKGIETSWQNAMLPPYVERKCPEIESLPFVAFGKSPAGTALETTYYFAQGNTDMTYSMLREQTEPWEFYEKIFFLFAQNREYWDRLSECNKSSFQSGMQYFMSKNIWAKKLEKSETIFDLNYENHSSLKHFLHSAIPFSFDTYDSRVTVLHPESAKFASNEEIETLLAQNVVTDGETVEILTARGFDLGIKSVLVPELDSMKLYEALEEHPSNKGGLKKWSASMFMPGKMQTYYLKDLPQNAEILGRYSKGQSDKKEEMEVSSAIITTKKGGKWAILGYVPWKGVVSFGRREQFLNVVDYVSDNALSARLLTPLKSVLMPRVDKDYKTVCVSILNCTVDKSEELQLLIRNPKSENFYFMTQRGIEKAVEYEKKGCDYIIKVPSIDAWTVGTVFCDK